MSKQSASVILDRILALKEEIPLCLAIDSVAQSAYYLIEEVIHRSNPNKIIYLSYQTINRPSYAYAFLDCLGRSVETISEYVRSSVKNESGKVVIVVDSFNYLQSHEVVPFISSIISSNTMLFGVYHTTFRDHKERYPNYPSTVSLLTYFASVIFEVLPQEGDEESLENRMSILQIPTSLNLNSSKFSLVLTRKRKSGRPLTYKYTLDTQTHKHEIYDRSKGTDDDTDLFMNLTTFNLDTSSKQKLAKEQVELPFMQAQEALGSAGGAIVYQFEKDDDYDEEDPYEDPF